MKKIFLLLTLISVQFTLIGCSSQQTEKTKTEKVKVQGENQRLTVVSSGKAADILPAFSTYSWSKNYNRVLSGVPGRGNRPLQSYIRQELQTYLNTKGYQYISNPKEADVVIGFLFALENDVANANIQKKFGLLPGLTRSRASDPRYEKGSLFLAVLDNGEKSTYWRSAVEGFIDLERKSKSRMQTILGTMLDSFPYAGQ